MLTRRTFVQGSAVLLVSSFSARADLYDDYINSVSKQPFVSFFARDDTLTGHAFVSLGTELDNGLTVYEGIFGYYPAGSGKMDIIKTFVGTKGIVTFKENDYPSKIRYRKDVDDATKEKAKVVLSVWTSDDPKYALFGNGGKNCNVLVKEIAEAMGLNTPSDSPSSTFPENYIRKLKEANP